MAPKKTKKTTRPRVDVELLKNQRAAILKAWKNGDDLQAIAKQVGTTSHGVYLVLMAYDRRAEDHPAATEYARKRLGLAKAA